MEEFPDMNEEEMLQASRIGELITAYINKDLDPAGHDELDAWVNADAKNMLLFEELTDERNRDKALKWMKGVKTAEALKKVKQRIGFTGKPRNRFKFRQYAVAACLLIAIALIADKLYTGSKHSKEAGDSEPARKQTILPGGNKATLTLDDGSKMVLADMRRGVLKNEAGVLIDKKNDGELIYNPGIADGRTDKESYNTLETPRGGEYMVMLTEGTKVWLNAASSIRYPVAMNGRIRKVYITGEVYFEVAKDPTRPFIAGFNESDVLEVLGTHFNIMNYADEDALKITLAEGSVRINEDNMLKPGEQYSVNRTNGKAQVITGIDLEEALSWKNGYFIFTNTPIQAIMRQLARWYDIEISYEGNFKSQDFTATVSKNDGISTILTRLEKTGAIHFKTEGKKITVLN